MLESPTVNLETHTVIAYEHQSYAGKGQWVPDPKMPWVGPNKETSPPPDEIELPDQDWTWVTNWRFEAKVPEKKTDRHGWEYG